MEEGTGPVARMVATWKRAVVRAQERLVLLGGAFVLLDVVAALSACFAPLLAPPLGIARVGVLAVLVPAVLRALAIRHADRTDADLLKAIAVAIGVAAVYLAVRTGFVVEVCSL